MDEISKTIKDHRERIGISQRNLAQRINVPHGSVQAWEIGRNEPSGSKLLAMIEELNIPPKKIKRLARICWRKRKENTNEKQSKEQVSQSVPEG